MASSSNNFDRFQEELEKDNKKTLEKIYWCQYKIGFFQKTSLTQDEKDKKKKLEDKIERLKNKLSDPYRKQLNKELRYSQSISYQRK